MGHRQPWRVPRNSVTSRSPPQAGRAPDRVRRDRSISSRNVQPFGICGLFRPEYGLELTRPGNEPWTMRLLVRRLPGLMDIRGCGDTALFRSGASFVDLRRLVDFRPFPKSAHLGIHRFTMTVFLYKISSLECWIGRECHDHQDDKNGNDEGWN